MPRQMWPNKTAWGEGIRVLQRNRTNGICIHSLTHTKKDLLEEIGSHNYLRRLSPKICTQQARASEDLIHGSSPSPRPENQESWRYKFQSRRQLARDARRAAASMGVWSWERPMAQLSGRRNYLALFLLLRSSPDWMRPTHLKEDTLL